LLKVLTIVSLTQTASFIQCS